MLLRTSQRPVIRRGFTLVEVAVAIIIVGTGSVALMQLTATCTLQNRAAADTTTAVMLAQHIQEMLATLPITDPVGGPGTFGRETGETLATSDDVDDFDGVVFSPCVDSSRTPLTGFTGYSQSITVVPVSGQQLSGNATGTAISKTTYTGAVRVRVQILKLDPVTNTSRVVHTLEWIRVED